MDETLLARTTHHIQRYIDALPTRQVRESVTREELTAQLGGPLPEHPEDPFVTIDRLAHAGEVGTVASSGPRYFGFVIGGSLPAAQAADWLTTAWDQNAGLYATCPVNSVAEEIASTWLLDLLGLPSRAAVGFTTGATMASCAALAAARHELLKRVGFDVEAEGLHGAPQINVLVSNEVHVTIFKALRLLGIGTKSAIRVKVDKQGRMLTSDVARALEKCAGPTIICIQAGNINSGSFDPVDEIADLAKRHRAWLHVDGAIGLWAAASPKYKHLLKGIEKADSWTLDGHKWLNVPYDCGIAIVANGDSLKGSFASTASYLIQATTQRDPHEYVADFSRRARGIPIYAALRSLGRHGLSTMVERCCDHAKYFAELLSKDARVEILNDVVLNQVVVRFKSSDEVTAATVRRVQQDGVCWLGGSIWQGKGVMRISVCNWSTTTKDVELSAAAILRALDG